MDKVLYIPPPSDPEPERDPRWETIRASIQRFDEPYMAERLVTFFRVVFFIDIDGVEHYYAQLLHPDQVSDWDHFRATMNRLVSQVDRYIEVRS